MAGRSAFFIRRAVAVGLPLGATPSLLDRRPATHLQEPRRNSRAGARAGEAGAGIRSDPPRRTAASPHLDGLCQLWPVLQQGGAIPPASSPCRSTSKTSGRGPLPGQFAGTLSPSPISTHAESAGPLPRTQVVVHDALRSGFAEQSRDRCGASSGHNGEPAGRQPYRWLLLQPGLGQRKGQALAGSIVRQTPPVGRSAADPKWAWWVALKRPGKPWISKARRFKLPVPNYQLPTTAQRFQRDGLPEAESRPPVAPALWIPSG